MPKLVKVECAPDCGFLVRSHSENEVVNAARAHSALAHNKPATEADARAWLQPA